MLYSGCNSCATGKKVAYFDVLGQLLACPWTSINVLCSWTYNFTLEKYKRRQWTSMDMPKNAKKMSKNAKKMSKVVQGRQNRLLFCLLHMNCNRCIK